MVFSTHNNKKQNGARARRNSRYCICLEIIPTLLNAKRVRGAIAQRTETVSACSDLAISKSGAPSSERHGLFGSVSDSEAQQTNPNRQVGHQNVVSGLFETLGARSYQRSVRWHWRGCDAERKVWFTQPRRQPAPMRAYAQECAAYTSDASYTKMKVPRPCCPRR